MCGSAIHGNCESLGSSADTIPENFQPFSKPPSGSIGTGRCGNTWSDRHDPAAAANEIVQFRSCFRRLALADGFEESGHDPFTIPVGFLFCGSVGIFARIGLEVILKQAHYVVTSLLQLYAPPQRDFCHDPGGHHPAKVDSNQLKLSVEKDNRLSKTYAVDSKGRFVP